MCKLIQKKTVHINESCNIIILFLSFNNLTYIYVYIWTVIISDAMSNENQSFLPRENSIPDVGEDGTYVYIFLAKFYINNGNLFTVNSMDNTKRYGSIADDEIPIPIEEYDPTEHRDVVHPTTNTDTLIHLLKGYMLY